MTTGTAMPLISGSEKIWLFRCILSDVDKNSG
jgi:hypothetical protein